MARGRDKQMQHRATDDRSTSATKEVRGVRIATRNRAGRNEEPGLDARHLSRRLFEETNALRALELAIAYYTQSPLGSSRVRVWLRHADRAIVRIPRTKRSSRSQCLATLAFFRDAVQMATGAKVEAKEERCVARGDMCCMHQIHWDEPAA